MNNLLTEIKNHILYLTINREAKLNALNRETLGEINQVITAAQKDDNVRVIIITGAGEKAFVAGADISEFANFNDKEGEKLAADGQKLVFDIIENSEKICIAAVNGFALGGGLELAMACHFRLASKNAKLGLPEVTLGVIPGYGGTQRLAQLVGKGKAMELISTANMLTADEALTWGLVNHTAEDKVELIQKCEALASKIAQNSPTAVSAAIKAVNAGYATTGYKEEIAQFGNCFGTPDFIEGTTAFMEKRKATFTGKQ